MANNNIPKEKFRLVNEGERISDKKFDTKAIGSFMDAMQRFKRNKSSVAAAFIILALFWLNSRSLALFISFLMVFPPVYLNVLEGIRQTDKRLLEMARVFRVPLWRRIRGIYLPAVMPYFRTAVSLGLGLCWKAGVAAEVIGLPTGSVGEQLYNAKVYFMTGDLFAWTVVIVVVSVLFEKLFLRLVDCVVRKAGVG